MTQTILGSSSPVVSEILSSSESKGNEENDYETITKTLNSNTKQNPPEEEYIWRIQWINVLAFVYLHLGALYGLYLCFTTANPRTYIFAYFYALFSSFGITAGAHRLWSHRSYKAKLPLRIILCIFQTIAFQNHIYEWARDHRVHHKFSETNADPHNAKRGFFFSHIGWLMIRKHADVKTKGKTVDMSDLENDPVVMFQKKNYKFLMPLLCFIIPTIIPWYFWNEFLGVSWYIAGVLRFTITLNGTWLVNSAAHMWGNKPYDKDIGPSNNAGVAFVSLGEGWHNYHHVFPWDYKTAELGDYSLNITKAFIDFFSYIGWAYDLKTVPQHAIDRRILKSGDGSHPVSKKHSHEGQFWGWGDKDMTDNDKNCAMIIKNKTE